MRTQVPLQMMVVTTNAGCLNLKIFQIKVGLFRKHINMHIIIGFLSSFCLLVLIFGFIALSRFPAFNVR